MPKSLVLGNGNMLVGLDYFGQVREFYFPYVGLENQTGSHFIHKIGIFVDDKFSWIDDGSWEIHINYQEESLVSQIQLGNSNLEIKIDLSDIVYNEKNIFIRHAKIENCSNINRQIKLFFHQEFEFYESHRGDTAYYDPNNKVIIHYKGRRVILVNACVYEQDKLVGSFDDYSIGLFQIEGKEGTYRDAEDGVLDKNPIEHGLVDSVIGVTCDMEAHATSDVYYWLCAAKFIKDAHDLNHYVIERTPKYLIGTTRDFWFAWVNRDTFKFHNLDERCIRLFKKSLLIMRTHVDNRGSILASGDSDILFHGRDTYAYMWPRDAAFIAMSLEKAGEAFVVKKFFEFCNSIVVDEGYFMHRYRADQSLGSSWHPFLRDGKPTLPIQEDETALILVALWQHYLQTKDLEFIEEVYNSLIKKCAEFLCNLRDEQTGLPKPSYDLWEEKFGITTFSSSAIYAALIAASKFAGLLGKVSSEEKYLSVAMQIHDGILNLLYDAQEGYFYKMINIKDGQIQIDKTIDSSSVYGIYKFGILSPNDEKVKKAIQKTKEKLTIPTEIGGLARYENDYYFRVSDQLTGNPWFITSLWMAQYSIATAKDATGLNEGLEWLKWAVDHSLPSGVMSEQLNPYSGEHISASPLIWSHAEYVVTVLKYIEKIEELELHLPSKESK